MVDKSRILYALAGLAAGLVIGFFVTNSLNRGELDRMRGEVARARTADAQGTSAEESRPRAGVTGAPASLTEEEIRGAIATADARPDDLYLQRNLGLSLFRYAGQVAGDAANVFYLEDVVRLLKRSYAANRDDHEVTSALAVTLLNIGQTADPSRMAEAREFYAESLRLKPDDVGARAGLGMTYFLGRPSDPERAISEYRRALAQDPRHELALQNLAAALIAANRRDEAQQRINELQAINPANAALPNLRAQLAQGEARARVRFSRRSF